MTVILLFLLGVLYPFVSTHDIGKNADFKRVDTREYSVSVCFCVATIGVCVFRCADSGWRTFYFEERNNKYAIS